MAPSFGQGGGWDLRIGRLFALHLQRCGWRRICFGVGRRFLLNLVRVSLFLLSVLRLEGLVADDLLPSTFEFAGIASTR